MPLISDVTDLVTSLTADIAAGKYASAAQDIGAGFNKLGDYLKTFVGFQGMQCTDDECCKLDDAIAKAKACPPPTVGAAGDKVGAFDPTQWFAAFQMLVQLAQLIRNLVKPVSPTPAPTA